jgi:methylglyoxal/glyoxal reductase
MEISSIHNKIKLNNAVEIPRLGLGTFRTREGHEIHASVQYALDADYRLIDTATVYGNETGIGEALKASGVPREDLFITTKVWNSDQGYKSALRAFEESARKLQLDVIDLYLIHWPVEGKFTETWKALEELQESGRVRAVGVSNFLSNHLEELMRSANVVPAVNQIEFHPHLQSPELIGTCHELGIRVEAWSPLMKGAVMEVPELVQIGDRHGKSAAQVSIRWMLQKDIICIPKSTNRSRIEENADVFDFELSGEEMALINSLDRGQRFGPDPADFDF